MPAKKPSIDVLKNEQSHAIEPDGALLLTPDSGRPFSLSGKVHPSMITGSTGSGKTRSVIVPMLASLLKAGCDRDALQSLLKKGRSKEKPRGYYKVIMKSEDETDDSPDGSIHDKFHARKSK